MDLRFTEFLRASIMAYPAHTRVLRPSTYARKNDRRYLQATNGQPSSVQSTETMRRLSPIKQEKERAAPLMRNASRCKS